MTSIRYAVLAVLLPLAGGCETTMERSANSRHVPFAVAGLHPTEGNEAEGTVQFFAAEDGVRVVAELSGLEPGSTHGFHIHTYGDCTAPDGTSAGGHFDPHGHDHALPPEQPRHAGDLGNVTAGEKGNAIYQRTIRNISICCGPEAILGRGVILHAQEDDGGQPTGNAGPRIACGVIGIGNAGH